MKKRNLAEKIWKRVSKMRGGGVLMQSEFCFIMKKQKIILRKGLLVTLRHVVR